MANHSEKEEKALAAQQFRGRKRLEVRKSQRSEQKRGAKQSGVLALNTLFSSSLYDFMLIYYRC
jgi:hypothetical protein